MNPTLLGTLGDHIVFAPHTHFLKRAECLLSNIPRSPRGEGAIPQVGARISNFLSGCCIEQSLTFSRNTFFFFLIDA